MELLRSCFKKETTKSQKREAAHDLLSVLIQYWKSLNKISPDEELQSFLRSPIETVRLQLIWELLTEQFHSRLDAAWYPLLNETFAKDRSMEMRGNAALILVLADDPQSEEKLKFIESICDPKYTPRPLTKEEIKKGLASRLERGVGAEYVLKKWNPTQQNPQFLPRPTEEKPVSAPPKSKE